MGFPRGSRLVLLAVALGSLVLPALPAAGAAPSASCALFALDLPPGPSVAFAFAALGAPVRESFTVADTVLACGPDASLREAARMPFVARAVPEERLEAHLADSRRLVHADFALDGSTLPGSGIAIALVDSGVDSRHPALQPAVRKTVRFTSTGEVDGHGRAEAHGTHVAGILAGNGAESAGARHRGLASGASLVALDISDAFTTTNALRAFEWLHKNHAAYDVRVVSNSWGREREDAKWDPEDPVVRASSALVADGLVVVFSAGNRGSGPSTVTLEAMNPDVLAVGATSKDGDVEPYSSRGPPAAADGSPLGWLKPDLVAPGTRIVSTRANAAGDGERARYVTMNGTSMAAPHVAAGAAVVLSARPDLAPAAVAAILRESAEDRGALGPDPSYGHGLLDVAGAVQIATTIAADRILVREEVRVPVSESGEVTSAGGRILLDDARGVAEGPLRIPVAGKAATSLDVLLTWSSAFGGFTVTVTDGASRLGPFSGTANRVLVRTPLPAGGPWRIEATPSELPDRASWALDGYATSLVEHEVASPVEARAWAAAARGPDGFFEEHARGGAMKNLIGPWGASRNLEIASGLAGSAFLVARWRRRA